MTTVHLPDIRKTSEPHFLPTGIWTALIVFGGLWLLPVIALIVAANT